MDGVELFERLAATPALASTTKVLLSTGRPLVAATVHRPGISASVAKPVVNTELHAPARLMSAVELAPGAGAAALSPAEWSRRPAPASGPGARGRVLVVEDNTTNQMLAMGLLARLGFDAEVVSNGQQAVEAVARTDYDTVLMDCHMPVMDGFEATAAIRHLGRDGKASGRPTRHVPIVAMTAGALVGNASGAWPPVWTTTCPSRSSWPTSTASSALRPERPGRRRRRRRHSRPGRRRPHSGRDRRGPAGQPAGAGRRRRRVPRHAGGIILHLIRDVATGAGRRHRPGRRGCAVPRRPPVQGRGGSPGANGLAALCEELERMASPPDRAAAGALVARSEREMLWVRQGLQAELGSAQVC